MKEVTCTRLKLADLHDKFLNEFNRYQETKRVWAIEGENLYLKDDYFIEKWDAEKKKKVIAELRDCMLKGGVVVGAFSHKGLIGFANVEAERFGTDEQYVELSYIHVSNEYRGYGIGKMLFKLSCLEAKRLGAAKLYIAAHPSEETQYFYRSLGCVRALEINKRIYEKEPLDLQLEYVL